MKTSELTGDPLDYAVALIEYPEWKEQGFLECLADLEFDDGTAFAPSTNWAQGGPIIEREGICLNWAGRLKEMVWEGEATTGNYHNRQYGPTPLTAAMRCYVASVLGDDVVIPMELSGGQL